MLAHDVVKNNNKLKIEYWHKIVLLLCLGWSVIWIYRPILTPILAELQITIGQHSNAALGWIASCYFLAYASSQVPGGILADKYGKKIILVPSFICFIVAVVIIANATSIMMVYVGSFLAGIGCGSYYGIAYSLAAECVPARARGISNAIINTGCSIGMSVSLIGASYLVKTTKMPWQYLMYMIALMLILMTIAFALIIKEKPKKQTLSSINNSSNLTPAKDKFELKQLFKGKIISFYVIYFASCYVYYMIITWLPNFLEVERNFTGSNIGFAASAIPLAAIFGAIIINGLSDLFREKRIHITVALALIAGIVLAITFIAESKIILIIGFIFYGFFGKLVIEPLLISQVAEIVPASGYSTSFSVFSFVGMSSTVISPALTGYLADFTGTKLTGFYLGVVVLIIAAIVFAVANKNVLFKSKN